MSEFAQKLQSAIAMEMSEARGNPDRVGEAVEAVISATAFTIALASKGDTKAASVLLDGAEAYLHESVAGFAKIAQIIG